MKILLRARFLLIGYEIEWCIRIFFLFVLKLEMFFFVVGDLCDKVWEIF